ncbi:MAG: hypothetical protein Q7W55_10365 [Pseudohongiella sp.]|nr:hypothetical protein [Pseudohongiella sp.]
MQLTRWTVINRDFEEGSRLSKKQWYELIEKQVVPGKNLDGVPYIDAARFAGTTTFTPPPEAGGVDSLDLLG